MSRPTYLTIDLSALRHNFDRVRAAAPKRLIIAMVKANAYGHGITRVAEALPEADAFGVASLEEGVILREAGITQTIVLMEGIFDAEELVLADKFGFSLLIHHLPHVEILEKMNFGAKGFSIWLKINTGMHRLGFAPNDINDIYQRLSLLPAIKKPIGLMTHFATADQIDSEQTASQIKLFSLITKNFAGPKSLANSAGILAWPESHGDWVRPGLMLYGASPFSGRHGGDEHLRPVMTLWSRLIAITSVKKNGKIGYGATWSAPEDMLVGVVGVGYGDGYPQFAKNGTPVLVNGVLCPLVGRVSMDMLTVDLRSLTHAEVGDKVILWGEGLPVEKVACCANTSPYEILTRMTPRPKVEVSSK